MFGGREEPEGGVGADHPLLVEERQAAGHLQHALDHEHHVGPAGIVLVEDERDIVLQRPGQDAVLEGGDLLAVLQHDRVLADEVDARDVAVEVDPDAGPVQASGDLLDMGRLAGAVIARDHHAAVLGEARQDGERGLAVEDVVRVEIRHVLVGFREGGHLEVEVDAEHLADRDVAVGHRGGLVVREHTGPRGGGLRRRVPDDLADSRTGRAADKPRCRPSLAVVAAERQGGGGTRDATSGITSI